METLKISPQLAVTIAGVKARMPLGWASTSATGPWGIVPEKYAQHLIKHAEAGAGFLTLATAISGTRFKSGRGTPTGRWLAFNAPYWTKEKIYVFMAPVAAMHHIDEAVKVIKILKEKLPDDVPLIGSIMGDGANIKSWVELAKIEEEEGVDLIEMNCACPTPLGREKLLKVYTREEITSQYIGALLSDMPDLLKEIVASVTKAVKVGVGVKFSTEIGFPRIIQVASSVKEAGAKYLTWATTASVCPPDIYNEGRSMFPYLEKNPSIASLHSPANIHIAMHYTARLSKFVPNIDLISSCGVHTPENIVQLIMLGANCVEVSSAVAMKGRALFKNTVEFLNNYMKKLGYKTIEDFKGLGLKWIADNAQVDCKVGKVIAETDIERCTGCGLCTDILCEAYYWENKKVLVNPELCGGC
ncbi:MAG: tRNA-dihydrouridine synthase, partial [Candidatus Bathyarchaeia archaeon]